jgi:hypothetical protein
MNYYGFKTDGKSFPLQSQHGKLFCKFLGSRKRSWSLKVLLIKILILVGKSNQFTGKLKLFTPENLKIQFYSHGQSAGLHAYY